MPALSQEVLFGEASVVGGMTTGRERLMPVGDAVVDSGLAGHVSVYELSDVMDANPKRGIRLGQVVVGHSLAIEAVARQISRLGDGEPVPGLVVAYAPTIRPISRQEMGARTLAKLGQADLDGTLSTPRHNVRRAMRHPFQTLDHARVLGSLPERPDFHPFSSRQIRLLLVFGGRDVLTPFDPDIELSEGVRAVRLGGSTHDRFLEDPQNLMKVVRSLLDHPEFT